MDMIFPLKTNERSKKRKTRLYPFDIMALRSLTERRKEQTPVPHKDTEALAPARAVNLEATLAKQM